MQQNFDLETILSVTTGISLVDNYYKVFELYFFAFQDNSITTLALIPLGPCLVSHLLTLYPELQGLKPDINNLNAWIAEQKIKFGGSLPVCRIGETLENEERHR